MALSPQYTRSPTVADITTFTNKFFPVRNGDVQYIYHRPFARSFDASRQHVSSIVLSVTPTAGFYDSLRSGSQVGFLHRPWALDRRRVPRGATVLACHKGFDEVLTVGYNLALAGRLSLDVESAAVMQGYKDDPERRIGVVAPFINGTVSSSEVQKRVLSQFRNNVEGMFGFDIEQEGMDGNASVDDEIRAVAIMNAFHPAEVDRVIEICLQRQMLQSPESCSDLLYLTGAVREAGLLYAREKGMKVICVGHRACEDWGIEYLAGQLRKQYPGVRVDEVYEAEEVIQPPEKKEENGKHD